MPRHQFLRLLPRKLSRSSHMSFLKSRGESKFTLQALAITRGRQFTSGFQESPSALRSHGKVNVEQQDNIVSVQTPEKVDVNLNRDSAPVSRSPIELWGFTVWQQRKPMRSEVWC